MIITKKMPIVVSVFLALNLQGCTQQMEDFKKSVANNPTLSGLGVGTLTGAGVGAATNAIQGKSALDGVITGAVAGAAAGAAAGYLCQLSQEFLANHQTEEVQGYKSLKKKIGYTANKGDVMNVSELTVTPTREAVLNNPTSKKVDISTEYYLMTPSENDKLTVKEVWVLETQDASGQYKREPEEGIIKPVIMKPGLRKSTTSLEIAQGKHRLSLELHYKKDVKKSSVQEFVV